MDIIIGIIEQCSQILPRKSQDLVLELNFTYEVIFENGSNVVNCSNFQFFLQKVQKSRHLISITWL
jgi:hypothetical protein